MISNVTKYWVTMVSGALVKHFPLSQKIQNLDMLWISNNNYSICQENTKIRPTSDTFCNKYVEKWGIKYGTNLVCPDYFYEIVCHMSSNRFNLTISSFFFKSGWNLILWVTLSLVTKTIKLEKCKMELKMLKATSKCYLFWWIKCSL